MEVAGIQAARWVLSKALGSITSGALEAWAASTELGDNIEALKMELLYAQGMLNNARGREIQNPALAELLQKLRDLGYRADDVLDELEYFRIQDELDGTYHAADEHEGGYLHNCALHARSTASAIKKKLVGFSKCCSGGDSHREPAGEGTNGGACGAWPCLGLATPSDDEEEEELGEQESDHGCMGRLTSGARNTMHAVGKHLPCPSASNSNIASNEQRRFLYCACPPKAPQREHVVQAPKLKFNRVEISQNMKDIVEQLKPVCAKVSTILNLELLDSNRNMAQWIATSLEGRASNKQWHTPIQKIAKSRPITTSELIQPKFYGREDKRSKIIHDITKGEYSDKALTVLPIVGPGGIGKTTLTQYIYNDVELNKHFEVKLWVCVSVNFNVYRLTQEIADKLSNEKTGTPDKLIEEKLKSKRFLLVLDDMWNCSDEDEWKRFLFPLNKGQTKGSVILVTTRFPAVAHLVRTVDDHIDLEGLDSEAFKQLFLACAFGDKETQNNHSGLLETGFVIMEKLKGSPLAAKTVGRLLRNNLDLDHWTRVLESREWESEQGDYDIMPALKLSFDYLPFHLQQCFTFCALFPEDYRFGREELIHFWVGLDVLHSHTGNISIEDIGLSYLNELVNHGFLKVEEEEDGGKCYVIHDLLHELALKVSANECLNIYSSNVSSAQIFPSIRHLSINIDDSSVKDRMTFDDCKKYFSALDKRIIVENLRSLMIFGKHKDSFAKTFSCFFSKAKSLRVIFLSRANHDTEDYGIEDLLPNYWNLMHLRYLRLPLIRESRLSNNISRYYHLRVLQVHGGYYYLIRDMCKLINLRHFIVEDPTMHSGICNVGHIKSLQGLQRFLVKKESQGFELRQLGELPELHGWLRIENLEKVESSEEAKEAKLIQKSHLHGLILRWDVERSNKNRTHEEQVLEDLKPCSNLTGLHIIGQGGVKCPSWLGENLSIKNLKSLCLEDVDWKTFPPIGILWLVNEEFLSDDVPNQNFHNLIKIELVNLKHVKKWVVDSTCQFYSCLEILIIKGCSELTELSISNSTSVRQGRNTWFPELRMLEIVDCPKLSSLPPIPWTCAPSVIEIRNICLSFERLYYINDVDSVPFLDIIGKGAHPDADDEFWMALDFDNLITLKRLILNKCPPLPVDHLKILSCLKLLSLSSCGIAIGPVEEGRSLAKFQLPIESIYFRDLDTSGKELTQMLSYMPKLLQLSISKCKNITRLGVMEQEKAPSSLKSVFPDWLTKRLGALAGQQILPWSRKQPHNSFEEEEETPPLEKGLLLLPPQLQVLRIYGQSDRRLDSVGFQDLRSLRSLHILYSPMFFSSYLAAASSSCLASPFPTSLQELELTNVLLSVPVPAAATAEEGTRRTVSLSNLTSLTQLELQDCGEGFSYHHLPRGCLTSLSVYSTRNFFLLPGHDGLLQQQEHGHGRPSSSSPFSVLQWLTTADTAGLLVAPICSLLSSSLTKLSLWGDKGMERFTKEQEEALQLLTSLQQLRLQGTVKLQCLPAAGLRGLTNLKKLDIYKCPAIRSLPKGGLPNSLQILEISFCSSIRLPPKDGLPNSLQELVIKGCPNIRSLPKDGLPSSLRLLDVRSCGSEELKSQCRKLIGTIPIVEV